MGATEWSEFTAIIDILKKREQEKRKKNDKRKKAGKVKRAENLENKENDPVCTNGDFNGINGIPPSTSKASEMEKTLENLSRTMMTLKSGESNKSVTSNKPGESRSPWIPGRQRNIFSSKEPADSGLSDSSERQECPNEHR